MAILRQAGSTQGIRRAGQRGFESRSPAAIRAALGGEQFYRRGMWDSAIVRYKEAVELDSSFTLAQWRLGRVLAWHGEEDPHPFLMRAAHTPGLSWLDSMLITADSISAALRRSPVPLGLLAAYCVSSRRWMRSSGSRRRSDAEAWYRARRGALPLGRRHRNAACRGIARVRARDRARFGLRPRLRPFRRAQASSGRPRRRAPVFRSAPGPGCHGFGPGHDSTCATISLAGGSECGADPRGLGNHGRPSVSTGYVQPMARLRADDSQHGAGAATEGREGDGGDRGGGDPASYQPGRTWPSPSRCSDIRGTWLRQSRAT